ncbi:MAG: flavodoxin family protein [Desulfobacteraceae bacterium]|nr:flavodoxin family protein [Desulfobacteraceae bacterium]
MAKVIGFCGSPIKSGNVEKAMEHVLESTGHEWELIRLSTKKISPCIGCVRCADNNRCVLKDDMNELLEKILEADAVLLGGFPTFGRVNALTKTFIERLFPLIHNHMLTKGKIAASVSGGFFDQETVKEDFSAVFRELLMRDAGSLAVDGNACCYKCGYGETCDYSAFIARYGKGAKITKDIFYVFDEDNDVREKAALLGKKIAGMLQ